MATTKPPKEPAADAGPLPVVDATEITGRDIRDGFGEALEETLNVNAWRTGWDASGEYSRLQSMVVEALRSETEVQKPGRTCTSFPACAKGVAAYTTHDPTSLRRSIRACCSTAASRRATARSRSTTRCR